MEKETWTVGAMLSTGVQRHFVVPRFQRRYAWDEPRWHDLWRDVGNLYMALQDRETPKAHFLGIMLLDAGQGAAIPRPHNLIDGQQRLVTLLLLLAAVRDAKAEEEGKTVKYDRDQLLYLLDEEGDRSNDWLVRPQNSDEEAVRWALHGKWADWARDTDLISADGPLRAYAYFRYCIWRGEESLSAPDGYKLPLPKKKVDKELTPEEFWQNELNRLDPTPTRVGIDLALVKTAVTKYLKVLVLSVQSDDEDAVEVFDAINGRRTEFGQWDHIRTYVFMRLGTQAEKVLEHDWEPVENDLDQLVFLGKRVSAVDQFVYDYLIARGESVHQGASINKNKASHQFEARVRRIHKGEPSPNLMQKFVKDDFLSAARSFIPAVSVDAADRLSFTKAKDNTRLPKIAQGHIDQIRYLSSGPPTPVVMHFVEAWYKSELTTVQLNGALGLTEAYLARHILAGTDLSPFRSRFMQLMGRLDGSIDVADLQRDLTGDNPSDELIRGRHIDELVPVYGDLRSSQLAALFRGVELQLSGGGANPLPFGAAEDEFSVEHIYPQSCAERGPNAAWAKELASWKKASDAPNMAEFVHSLGNLVLLTNKANKQLKTKSFESKVKAFTHQDPQVKLVPLSHLRDVEKLKQWTSAEIRAHAKFLIDAALKRWAL